MIRERVHPHTIKERRSEVTYEVLILQQISSDIWNGSCVRAPQAFEFETPELSQVLAELPETRTTCVAN